LNNKIKTCFLSSIQNENELSLTNQAQPSIAMAH